MASPNDHNFKPERYAELISIINKSSDEHSPLQALAQKVNDFLCFGPDAAFAAFQNLQDAICKGKYKWSGTRIEIPVTSDFGVLPRTFGPHVNATTIWRTPTIASTLVMLFACDTDGKVLQSLLTDHGRTFGGLLPVVTFRKTPTSSLSDAFERAKSTAISDDGKTTILVVSLHDVHDLEMQERGVEDDYLSFSHFFTIGIGPAGIMVWQAWGVSGYGFADYIRDGHARLRNWDEARQFVSDFDQLANHEGNWSAVINDIYKRLFLIDIDQVCGEDGLEPPVTSQFKAWVRIRTFEDVTCEKVAKFYWGEK